MASVLLLAAAGAAAAQQYIISTVAGGSPPPTPASAASTSLRGPFGIAADGSGNVFFVDANSVFRLDQTGVLTLVAGNSRGGYSGDGGAATSAQLYYPDGIALDPSGNLYIADTGNSRIRKVSASGTITTVAGNGLRGYSGDAGPAVSAELNQPSGIALDAAGNLYIADSGNSRIRKVSPDGVIVTSVGSGVAGYSGDGGAAASARLDGPSAIAVAGDGSLYIADTNNSRIRKVSSGGIVTTIAGNGTAGYSGDGGPATNARLNQPLGVALCAGGEICVADSGNSVIREFAPGGLIATLAGAGAPGFSGDGASAAQAQLNNPVGAAMDSTGNLYLTDNGNFRVRRVSSAGVIATVAGNGLQGYSGDGGPATSAQIGPIATALDTSGNLYVADFTDSAIRKISPSGAITTIAGNGTPGDSGDGGQAISARLNEPFEIALDGAGNLYVADFGNSRIRRISSTGIISTVAGAGAAGYSGDGGLAINAQLDQATGVALDGAGNIYIADYRNSRIRKVSSTGVITTFAGTGVAGYSGDGGQAVRARLDSPAAIVADGVGDIYIADTNNCVIRMISPGGVIATVAGNGTAGYSGDGGLATLAQLNYPYGVAVDAAGNIYIADSDSSRIRKVAPQGIVSTVAGTGIDGYSGDGGAASTAQLNSSTGVTVDGAGNLYIADINNNAIRELRPTAQTVLISAVLDAAGENAFPLSPGKIVAIYGVGLGPAALAVNQPVNNVFGPQVGGSSVTFNGIPAPMYYAASTQLSAIVPYGVAGSATAQVVVTSSSGISAPFSVPVAASAPSFFSANATGAGQIAAVNLDGALNDATHPVAIGGYISLYATGEGQTSPAGIDGQLALTSPYPAPVEPVQITIGGISVTPAYAGAAPTEVAGLMQIVVQIPPGVPPGGYVPVVLQVGGSSTVAGATWIAVSASTAYFTQ